VQAKQLGLKIVELPVPLIYLDFERSFGGALDQSDTRLAVYRNVIADSIERSGQMAVGSGQKAIADNSSPLSTIR
jgi:dolichol-phosphate mannosyltransferase